MRAAIPVLFQAILLAACGFEPLYRDGTGRVAEELAGIRLQSVTGAEEINFELRKALGQFLPATGTTAYTMQVSARGQHRSVAVTSLANTIRFNYELTVSYTLSDIATGQSYRDQKSVVTSYGVVVSEYSSRVGREVAAANAAKEMAERIKFELIVFLRNKEKTNLEQITGAPDPDDISREQPQDAAGQPAPEDPQDSMDRIRDN